MGILEQVQDTLDVFVDDIANIRTRGKNQSISREELEWLADNAAWLQSELIRLGYTHKWEEIE